MNHTLKKKSARNLTKSIVYFRTICIISDMVGKGDIYSNIQEVAAISHDLEEGPLRQQGFIEEGAPNGKGIAGIRGTYAALQNDIEDLIGRLDGVSSEVGDIFRRGILAASGLDNAKERVQAVNNNGNAGLEEAANLLSAAEGAEVNASANLRGAHMAIPEHITVLRGLREALKTNDAKLESASADNADAKSLTHKGKARLDAYVDAQRAASA